MKPTLAIIAAAAVSFVVQPVLPVNPAAAETTECTEITAVPATINIQGIYCLKGNLVTSTTAAINAITINTNNVTIDLNGWKLGGSASGAGTIANGIYALNRKNIIIRNGSIRGFYYGILLEQSGGTSSGHVIEHILADGNRYMGMWVAGDNTTIRGNKVTNTGSHSIVSSAHGIHADQGTGVTISDNVVSGVEETGAVFGISMTSVSDGDVRGNRVFDLNTASARYGIGLSFLNRVAVKNNTISTGTGGTTGIGDYLGGTNNIACIDNQVSGFTNNYNGCDTNSGNVEF